MRLSDAKAPALWAEGDTAAFGLLREGNVAAVRRLSEAGMEWSRRDVKTPQWPCGWARANDHLRPPACNSDMAVRESTDTW